ncbi:hypothetical protein C1645_841936, partial [Glomus cerebriforme]
MAINYFFLKVILKNWRNSGENGSSPNTNPAASLQAATSSPLTGADASSHAPNNPSTSKGKAKVSDNDSSNASPPLPTPSPALEWQVITKKKPIHAISNVKHVNVTFDSQQAAEYACTVPISADNTSSFELVS